MIRHLQLVRAQHRHRIADQLRLERRIRPRTTDQLAPLVLALTATGSSCVRTCRRGRSRDGSSAAAAVATCAQPPVWGIAADIRRPFNARHHGPRRKAPHDPRGVGRRPRPSLELDRHFAGSLLDDEAADGLQRRYFGPNAPRITLDRLECRDEAGARQPLLRRLPTHDVPHLTTAALTAILTDSGAEVVTFDLEQAWRGDAVDFDEHDLVLLSTSFICNRASLRTALRWISAHSDAPLVLGGQYSNIKYAGILRHHPEVTAIIRGDGEHTIPALVHQFDPRRLRVGGRPDLREVPNVVVVGTGDLRVAPLTYVDLASMPGPPSWAGSRSSPMSPCVVPVFLQVLLVPGGVAQVPLPRRGGHPGGLAPLPRRQRRHPDPGVGLHLHHSAPRMRELMAAVAALRDPDFPTWEGFSRAATIKNADYVEMLEAGRCHQLSIGFESMSDDVLGYMGKRVSAAQNRTANELLRSSRRWLPGHFMVGYPGERPEDFALTADYLAEEYAGEFKLSVFSFTDETMPVWADADRFGIVIDPEHPEYGWRHDGMDVRQALGLHHDTIRRVRWSSDDAVWLFWQRDFELPLVPGMDRWTDLYVQKLVERLIATPVDHPDPRAGADVIRGLLAQLRMYGVRLRRDPVAA